jgi:hypothetical protein
MCVRACVCNAALTEVEPHPYLRHTCQCRMLQASLCSDARCYARVMLQCSCYRLIVRRAAGRSTAMSSGTATAPLATCTLQPPAVACSRCGARMHFHAPVHAHTADTPARARARTHALAHARTHGWGTPAQVSAAEGVALQHLQQLRQGIRPPLPVGAHPQ